MPGGHIIILHQEPADCVMSCTASFTKERFRFRIFFTPQLEVIHFLLDSCEKGTMFLWQLLSAVILPGQPPSDREWPR